MSRKHYILLAAALKELRDTYPQHEMYAAALAAHAECVDAIAVALKRENPAFDRARFLAAAGVQS